MSALKAVQQENALLGEKIELLVRRVFSSTCERLSPNQLELLALADTPPVATASIVEKSVPQPVSREPRERAPRLPEHLPVVEDVIDPEPVKAAPEEWRKIGEEFSEQLDYESRPLPAAAADPSEVCPKG